MTDTPSIDTIQQHFLAALPKITEQAKFHFKALDRDNKAEAVAATVAIVWRQYLRLWERGKDANSLLGSITDFSAKQVKAGRRIDGQEKAKDVMSRLAVFAAPVEEQA